MFILTKNNVGIIYIKKKNENAIKYNVCYAHYYLLIYYLSNINRRINCIRRF